MVGRSVIVSITAQSVLTTRIEIAKINNHEKKAHVVEPPHCGIVMGNQKRPSALGPRNRPSRQVDN